MALYDSSTHRVAPSRRRPASASQNGPSLQEKLVRESPGMLYYVAPSTTDSHQRNLCHVDVSFRNWRALFEKNGRAETRHVNSRLYVAEPLSPNVKNWRRWAGTWFPSCLSSDIAPLAPCEYHLLRPLKTFVARERVTEIEDDDRAVDEFFDSSLPTSGRRESLARLSGSTAL